MNNNESSAVLKLAVLGGVCFLILGAFFMFGESIWAPQSVKIREKAIRESSTYIEGRIQDLREGAINICSPLTPKENIDGLILLFRQTADGLNDEQIPDDLKNKVDLARQGKSICE